MLMVSRHFEMRRGRGIYAFGAEWLFDRLRGGGERYGALMVASSTMACVS